MDYIVTNQNTTCDRTMRATGQAVHSACIAANNATMACGQDTPSCDDPECFLSAGYRHTPERAQRALARLARRMLRELGEGAHMALATRREANPDHGTVALEAVVHHGLDPEALRGEGLRVVRCLPTGHVEEV